MKKDTNVVLINILGTMTLLILGYITFYILMGTLNGEPFSDILIDLKIYSFYYKVINVMQFIMFCMIIAIIVIAPLYISISIYLGLLILLKYIDKKRNMVKLIILSVTFISLIITTLKIFPLTSSYIIKVNSKVNDISNTEVSEFVKEHIKEDYYITFIEIRQRISK